MSRPDQDWDAFVATRVRQAQEFSKRHARFSRGIDYSLSLSLVLAMVIGSFALAFSGYVDVPRAAYAFREKVENISKDISESFSDLSEGTRQFAAAETSGFGEWISYFLFGNKEQSTPVTPWEKTIITTKTLPPPPIPTPSSQRVASSSVIAQPIQRPASSQSQPIQQTIVNNPVIERVIERVTTGTPASLAGYVTQSELLSQIAAVKNSFGAQLYGPSYPAPASTFNNGGISGMVAAMGRIDNLKGTNLSSITVSGVSGLTDADLPDGLTASNYLPLAGGTLTGTLTGTNLTLSGNLTVSGAQTISGAITIPYVNATSTVTDSTFVRFTATNATTANATSTNLFSTLGRFTNSIVDTLFTAVSATITNLTANTITATNATTTQLDAYNYVAVGRTATTTIRGDGLASTIPYASSTAMTVSGTGYFGTASTTNLTISGITSSLLSTNGTGAAQSATVGNGLSFSSNTLSTSFGTTSANTYTALQQFSAGASTSRLSIFYNAYLGATATSTFDSTGALSLVSNGLTVGTNQLVVSSGNVGIGTTSPYKTLSVAGDINFTGKFYEDGAEILSSMIAPFASACPTGWTEYTAARGRSVVGTPSGGTNAGTVGTALTNLGTRTTTDVAAHTHSVDPPNTSVSITDPGHSHTIGIQGPGGGASAGTWVAAAGNGVGEGTTVNTTGITASVNIAAFTSASAGVASVDVTMPYIQLTYCQKTAGSDIAEWIPATGELSKETIVSADPGNREKAVISSKEYDNSVIGIIATKPGWLLGQETKDSVQLALAGRVPVRVSLKNGEIKPGDPITTSSIPGVGMRATKAGPIVGKAMEAVNETSATNACTDPVTGKEEKCATALVFVNVSWWSPSQETPQDDYATQIASSYYEPIGVNDDLTDGDVVDLYYDYPPVQGHPDQHEKMGHIGRAEVEEEAGNRAIAGVISTKIGGEGSLLRRMRSNNKIIGEIRLVENGKAEMKVASDSAPIEPGDAIARSHTEDGRGARATIRGPILGRALEGWSPGSGKEKISVMIDASWYDSSIFEQIATVTGTTSVAELITDAHPISDAPWIGAFKEVSQNLKAAISGLADTIITFVGRAIYASIAVFEKVFTKELHAENVTANKGLFKELCVGMTCVTEEQFMAVFGTEASRAAASGGSGGNSVPSSKPAPEPEAAPTENASSTLPMQEEAAKPRQSLKPESASAEQTQAPSPESRSPTKQTPEPHSSTE